MKLILSAIIIGLFSASTSFAQATNVLYQHNPVYQDPNDPGQPNLYYYVPDTYLQQFRILHTIEGQPFEFEAVLYGPNGQYQDAGDINLIEADANAGAVTVTVVGNINAQHGQPYGAANVKQITLNATGVTGTLGDVKVRDGLANIGSVAARTLAGNVVVGAPNTGGADILHDITVEQFDGVIDCHTLRNLTANGEGTHLGSLRVRGDYRSSDPNEELTVRVYGSLAAVRFDGDMDETVIVYESLDSAVFESDLGGYMFAGIDLNDIYVAGDLQGTIEAGTVEVPGSVGNISTGATWPGSSIYVFGDITTHLLLDGSHAGDLTVAGILPDAEVYGDVAGTIAVGQASGRLVVEMNVTGAIDVSEGDLTGSIEIKRSLSGRITIDGGLGPEAEPVMDLSGGYISVYGSFTSPGFITLGRAIDPNSTAFIAIDYNGWQSGDDWGSNDPNDANNPYVRMGSDDPNHYYYGNTPALQIWHITECRGDMNNDGTVNYGDVNGFTLALSQPGVYAVRYPGLGGLAPDPNTGGSRVYHGDMNCDGEFTYADINPFTYRLQHPCCSSQCEPCEGEQLRGGAGAERRDSPAEMALQLTLNVDPDLYDDLVEIVAQAAAGLDDAGDRAYWQAVYGYLAE